MDEFLAKDYSKIYSAAGQQELKKSLHDMVLKLDEEFCQDQLDSIIRFAIQEKFLQRGLVTKKGPNVPEALVKENPLLAHPLPVGVPCDDGCTCVMAILLPTMMITCNVGDSRITLLRSSDLATLYKTMDQDMTVVSRVQHIVNAQGTLLRKGGPQNRLMSFLPKPGEKTDANGVHFTQKVWSEARVALPEEWKEVEVVPPRYFKATKTLNLAGVIGDITFKLSKDCFNRLRAQLREIDVIAANSVSLAPQSAINMLVNNLKVENFRVFPEMKTIVDNRPDIDCVPINPADERLFLVIASDGLWQYLRMEDDSELRALLQPHYPIVLQEVQKDVQAIAAKAGIELALPDPEQRAALHAELEENPKSVRRLMQALHRVVNEFNTYVLMPQRSSNLVRDDFSSLVMDIQILRGLHFVPNAPAASAISA